MAHSVDRSVDYNALYLISDIYSSRLMEDYPIKSYLYSCGLEFFPHMDFTHADRW